MFTLFTVLRARVPLVPQQQQSPLSQERLAPGVISLSVCFRRKAPLASLRDPQQLTFEHACLKLRQIYTNKRQFCFYYFPSVTNIKCHYSLFISRAAYLLIFVGASLTSFFHYCLFLLFSPQICLYAMHQWDWKMKSGITR